MNEYIKTALANQYTRGAIVGLSVGIVAATPYIQSKVSTVLNNTPTIEAKVARQPKKPKMYQIKCPEGFTALGWAKGEGLDLSDGLVTKIYERFNGEGHLPQPGRSTLFLSDVNEDNVVAGVKVTPADEVTDIHAMQDLVQRRTRDYNRDPTKR